MVNYWGVTHSSVPRRLRLWSFHMSISCQFPNWSISMFYFYQVVQTFYFYTSEFRIFHFFLARDGLWPVKFTLKCNGNHACWCWNKILYWHFSWKTIHWSCVFWNMAVFLILLVQDFSIFPTPLENILTVHTKTVDCSGIYVFSHPTVKTCYITVKHWQY